MTGWIQTWGGHYVWGGPGPRPAHAPDEAPAPVPDDVPRPAPFVPEFIEGVRLRSIQTGMPPEGWPLNDTYFVTAATAEAIRQRVGGVMVLELPFDGTGGPFFCAELVRHVVFVGGKTIVAGILADCWRRNPNNENVALQEVRDLIAQVQPKIFG